MYALPRECCWDSPCPRWSLRKPSTRVRSLRVTGTGRILTRTGQPMPLVVSVTARIDTQTTQRFGVADVTLSALAEGEYVLELSLVKNGATDVVSHCSVVPEERTVVHKVTKFRDTQATNDFLRQKSSRLRVELREPRAPRGCLWPGADAPLPCGCQS